MISQDAVDAVVEISRGNCGINGTTIVWMSDTSSPQEASTAFATPGRWRTVSAAGSVGSTGSMALRCVVVCY